MHHVWIIGNVVFEMDSKDQAQMAALEDKVAHLADSLGKVERAILYRYLYNQGLRIAAIDAEIRNGLKELREAMRF